LPRLCDECKAVIPQHLDICPQCGAVKVKITKVCATDGELVAFGSGDRPKRNRPTIEEMREFYGELKFIGRKRNRSQWWPEFAFKDRFGFKPTDSRFSGVEPRPPSIATVNFVRSRDIAFAKSREKGRRHG
jgi:DNA repair protein RadD